MADNDQVVDVDLDSHGGSDVMPGIVEVDGNGRSPSRKYSSDIEEDISDDGDDGNQLPNVEEYKAEMEASVVRPPSKLQRRKFRKQMLITAAFIIAATLSITLGVILGRDASSNRNSYNNNEGYYFGDDALPSPAPTLQWKTRREHISNMVEELGWSDPSVIYEASSPQFAAAVWLGDNDPQRLDIVDNDEFRQRYALAVLYYAWRDDITEGWCNALDTQIPWLTGDNVCKWNTYFSTVSDDKVKMGVDCGSGGTTVKQIILPNCGIEGAWPDELRLLEDLEGLYLGGNEFSGEIGSSIRSLSNLKDLDLHGNFLQGPVPDFLGTMTSLETLNLAQNYFSGPLPNDLAAWSNLETLNIGYNNITGNIDRFNGLSRIRVLDISNNTLTGSLTQDLLQKWSNIEILDASDNKLRGTLPENLFEMPKLKILDLHSNFINGTLPRNLVEGNGMEFLALHDNDLKGSIDVIPEGLKKLSHLDLSDNEFNGTIPNLENLSNLRYLFLAFNGDLAPGPIPTSVTKLSKLVDLSFQATNRNGAIPSGFGDLKDLTLLDLGFNDLTGPIPEDLGMASSLRFLFLNRNEGISGSIPASFSYLTGLEALFLSKMGLSSGVTNICENKPSGLNSFVADCSEISCPDGCCTDCCNDDDEGLCNDIRWIGNLDPVQEYEYRRSVYKFQDIVYKSDSPEDMPVSSPAADATEGTDGTSGETQPQPNSTPTDNTGGVEDFYDTTPNTPDTTGTP